ncbi:DUF1499 domain-containing protein [Methylomonas sp. MgM2]
MNTRILIAMVGVITLTGCTGTIPELGVNSGKLLPCPKTPNCVSSQAADDEHFIEPLHYGGTRQEARNRLLQIIKSEKRTRILAFNEDYIRAEFTSAVFRFVDDVEFYLPEKQTEQALVQIRSASRIGYSDLGTNRERIERIRGKFND